MGYYIDARSPCIRQHGENQLTRIENRRRRVTEKGHPRVLLGLPQRPSALVPFLLNPLIQRIIIMCRIPESELAIEEKSRSITDQKQCREAGQDEKQCEKMAHESPLSMADVPSRGQPRS